MILVKGNPMKLDKESLIDLICKHCDFYKESEKDLECGAYRILKRLLEKKIITPEEISDALRE
jgi:hypothetical protein